MAKLLGLYLLTTGSIGTTVWYRDKYGVPLWQFVLVFVWVPIFLAIVGMFWAAESGWNRIKRGRA
jgi:hypothetical protein